MSNLTANDTALNIQMNRLGFWCAVICIATGLLAVALPLDVPGGYDATPEERLNWLAAHRGFVHCRLAQPNRCNAHLVGVISRYRLASPP